MRQLTAGERILLDEALKNLWTGTMASQEIEGVEVPRDAERPEITMNDDEEYQLAVSLGILQG